MEITRVTPTGLPDISAWQAQVIRATAFHEPSPSTQVEGWWESVTGETPEARNSQPRQGAIQESGPFLEGLLTLNVNPLRIDWMLSPKSVEGDAPQPRLPVLGTLPKLIERFCASINGWLSVAPPVKRLAFGCIALQEAANKREGYVLLGRYLPGVLVDPDDSADLLYQINRPRRSSVESDLRINRLMRWSVARIQGLNVQVTLTAGEPASVISGVPVSDIYACRMELDINTAPERSAPFRKDDVHKVLGELAGLSLEIASRGDMP